MIAMILTLVAFLGTVFFARQSVTGGLIAVFTVGYGYGIIRANLPGLFSHFLFDAAVLGFYLVHLYRYWAAYSSETTTLKTFFLLLVIWPIALFFVPLQDWMVQLVGLRANIFFLPFLLIGAQLRQEEWYSLAKGLAILNLLTFIIAGVEYFVGVEQFFPLNELTDVIYRSRDVAGYQAFRIPATFHSAHAYAGTMVSTLPILFGAWLQPTSSKWLRYFFPLAMAVTGLGILMAATRVHFVVMAVLIVVATLSAQMRPGVRLIWMILMGLIGLLTANTERLQRFSSLQDTEFLEIRLYASLNKSFLDIIDQYTMGNGLGGGGTSLPYFLQARVQNAALGLENEYSRLVLEQGIIGLVLWLIFLAWIFTRRTADKQDSWFIGKRLAWFTCLAYFAVAVVGIGLFVAVPQSCVTFLLLGWIAIYQPAKGSATLGSSTPTYPIKRQYIVWANAGDSDFYSKVGSMR
jgi:hypothetical protein